MASVKLKELPMRELLEYERATHIICAKYENLNKMENFISKELFDRFSEVKSTYDKIVDEIEKRVDDIK